MDRPGNKSNRTHAATLAASEMTPLPTERTLLDKARRGAPEAIEALVEAYQGTVYRFGLNMCGDREDARDVLQETMLAMARGVQGFQGKASLSTWLYAVARNFCLKKRRQHQPDTEDLDESAGHLVLGADPHELVERLELENTLRDAVLSLEQKQREVLVLRDIEGMKTEEVAEVLGIGVAAVKSRLHRARAKLRERLAPLIGRVADGSPDCPDIVALLSRKLEGEVTPELCKKIEAHVRDCLPCRERCDSLNKALSLCQESSASKVPESIQEQVRREVRRRFTIGGTGGFAKAVPHA